MEVSVRGLYFDALPEVARLRKRLRDDLGPNFTPLSALDWWVAHRDLEYPVERSKLNRITSSYGKRIDLLPASLRADSLWALIHASSAEVLQFEFLLDGSTIRVHAETPPPSDADAEAAEVRKQFIDHFGRVAGNRMLAEKMAKSAFNLGALFVARELGIPGAEASALIQLLSPAQWWGPGCEDWNRCDDTWLCADKRDFLGRVVARQGRLFWHVGSSEDECPARSAASCQDTNSQEPSSESRLCDCSGLDSSFVRWLTA